MTFDVSSSHLLMILTYIANEMDPDQMAFNGAALSGLIVFDSMIKFCLHKQVFMVMW